VRPRRASRAVEGGDPCRGLRGQEAEPVPALPEVGDAAERRIALAAEDDRWVRLLDRLREHAERRYPQERAVVARQRLRPERAHRGEVFAAARGAIVERDAEGLELLAQPADADAEVEPAAGEDVRIGDLLGRVQRRPLRDEADPRAEANAAGQRCREPDREERLEDAGLARQREAAVRRVRIPGRGAVEEGDVLGEPERVEARPLGGRCRDGQQVTEPRRIAGERQEETEVHGRRSCPGAYRAGKS